MCIISPTDGVRNKRDHVLLMYPQLNTHYYHWYQQHENPNLAKLYENFALKSSFTAYFPMKIKHFTSLNLKITMNIQKETNIQNKNKNP